MTKKERCCKRRVWETGEHTERALERAEAETMAVGSVGAVGATGDL